ncbi:hypothetical protein ACSBR2_007064 [Camellia fascicularis]
MLYVRGSPTSVCKGLLSHFISRLVPLTLHRPFPPVGEEQNRAVGMPKRTIRARHGDRWLYLAPSVETPSEWRRNRAVRMPKRTICARHGDQWLYLAPSVGTPSGVTGASATGG